MFYSVSISSKSEGQVLRVLVSSAHELSDDEIAKLQAKLQKLRGEIFAQKEMISRCVDVNTILAWKEPTEVASAPLKMTIRKIRSLQPGKTLLRTRKELYQKCLLKTPDSPFKFLWSFFVAPFLALYRFHTQDRVQKLHKLFGTEVRQQKQLVSQLKRMKKTLSRGAIGKEAALPRDARSGGASRAENHSDALFQKDRCASTFGRDGRGMDPEFRKFTKRPKYF